MKKRFTILTTLILISINVFNQNTETIYLSGTGKDNKVNWDFFCTEGMNSGKWTTIGVPSCWELEGFGIYNYGHDYRDTTKLQGKEQGHYKRTFKAEKSWEGKQVEIVFEGSMTDTEVKINGILAGEIHQGSFYQFRYDITKLLKFDEENLLEVNVSKWSSNESVNQAERFADYWVFGGIFRPVYLEVKPKENIRHIAIDAKADGSFYADIYLKNAKKATAVTAIITTIDGLPVARARTDITKGNKQILKTRVQNVKQWNPESPNLYNVEIALENNEGIIHYIKQKFGFRTVELRKHDGIYVNNVKIMMKGVNRHCFHPESGRTTSKELSIQDVILIKEMNMNSVRMSHYPPDRHFLDACDSLGLFVLDELAGWQWPSYDTEVGLKLVKEVVERDVNHPCIILWDNANEGGWNTDLDKEFAKYDPQKRHVIHPWAKFNGTDTQHYKTYGYGTNSYFNGDNVFFPTEFLHGLYDGGHGAGLEDYWNLMLQNPLSAGGFLWCLLDEGVVRKDKNGIIDTDGNHAPDGILGPYREKEASFYSIKEIWSPVYIHQTNITPEFIGKLIIENRYYYTNLNLCSFYLQLVDFPTPSSNETVAIINKEKKLRIPSIEPQMRGIVDLELPPDWSMSDAVIIQAIDPHGKEIYSWTWMIKTNSEMAEKIITKSASKDIAVSEVDNTLKIECNDIILSFNISSGILNSIEKKGKSVSINNGPVFVQDSKGIKETRYFKSDDNYLIEAIDSNDNKAFTWTITGDGWLSIEYSYMPEKGNHDFIGITFDYPENKVKSVKMLADGPYRVWKNRLPGAETGVWKKEYNNTITGVTFDYPEFKGYYNNFYWMVLETEEMPITVVSESNNIYLRLLTPEFKDDSREARAPFPKGNISFLHAIPPIGTKFHKAEDFGPKSAPNQFWGWHRTVPPYTGKISFKFGK